MIYLDSCAVIKLLRTEQCGEALHAYVSTCATDRSAASSPGIARLPLDGVIRAAAELPHRHRRSLDALHLASALGLGRALSQFVTYDRQVGKAAEEIGLPVLAPGA